MSETTVIVGIVAYTIGVLCVGAIALMLLSALIRDYIQGGKP